jgi:hypothetical protein
LESVLQKGSSSEDAFEKLQAECAELKKQVSKLLVFVKLSVSLTLHPKRNLLVSKKGDVLLFAGVEAE